MSDEGIKVLLIEDNPADVRLVREMLAGASGSLPITLECADRLSEGLKRLKKGRFDAFLLDLGLPDSQGLETLDKARSQDPDMNIVVMTGLDDEALGLEAIKKGAQEYLVKGPLTGRALILALRYAVERHRMGDELRQLEERYHGIVEAANEGIWVLDADSKISLVNRRLAEMLGYAPEEMVAKSPADFMDEATQKLALGHLELRKQGLRDRHEGRLLRKDGTPIDIIVSATLFFDESGNYTGQVSIHLDISERKRAEEALRESEERFRLLAERSRDLIYRYRRSPAPGFEYVSSSAITMTGYTPEEHYADPELGFKIVHPDDRPKLQAFFAGEGVLEESLELRLVRKNGTLLWTEQQNVPIYDGAGNLVAIEGIARDVTWRKNVEDQLRQSLAATRVTMLNTIVAMASVAGIRDAYTADHQKGVTKLACNIAKEMGLSDEQIEGLHLAGLIHDIGMVSVPAEIISKPARLNEAEFNLIKKHPERGHNILKDTEFPWPIAQIVLQHHERMDGSGYPSGLRGEDILPEARILAVADAVEAMVSHRPYRPALSSHAAIDEISDNRGLLYDSGAVDACLRLLLEKGFQFDTEDA